MKPRNKAEYREKQKRREASGVQLVQKRKKSKRQLVPPGPHINHVATEACAGTGKFLVKRKDDPT